MPDVITHNAAGSACEKGPKAKGALEGFQAMRSRRRMPDGITHNAAISAWEKGPKAKGADAISACEKGPGAKG